MHNGDGKRRLKQKERNATRSTMCLEKCDKPPTVEQIEPGRSPRGTCPACVALNIVIFVYRAYNSHAKGTVLFYKGERERETEEEGT